MLSEARPHAMLIEVEWTQLDDDRHPLWADPYCLYAYRHPMRNWILYVGKADDSSVRKRLSGDHKSDDFADIELRQDTEGVRVIHRQLPGERGTLRTSQLVSDAESHLSI